MVTIKEIDGNILDSKANYICHCVNCQGKMGSGIAKALRNNYPEIFEEYSKFIKEKTRRNTYFNFSGGKELLGMMQIVPINNNKQNIVNMFCQQYYGYDGKKYVSYDAIDDAFDNLCKYIETNIKFEGCNVVNIAIPYKFASGLAGGNWNIVKEIITERLNSYEFSKYIILEIWKLKED